MFGSQQQNWWILSITLKTRNDTYFLMIMCQLLSNEADCFPLNCWDKTVKTLYILSRTVPHGGQIIQGQT